MRSKALAILTVFGLFAMPLQAVTCPGQCDWPTDPGENPRCNQYFVLIIGCFGYADMCESFTCHWNASVEDQTDNKVVLASVDPQQAAQSDGLDPKEVLCTAADHVNDSEVEADSPEIEVLEAVQIPART